MEKCLNMEEGVNKEKGVLDASKYFTNVVSSMKVQFPNELLLFVDLHLFLDLQWIFNLFHSLNMLLVVRNVRIR